MRERGVLYAVSHRPNGRIRHPEKNLHAFWAPRANPAWRLKKFRSRDEMPVAARCSPYEAIGRPYCRNVQLYVSTSALAPSTTSTEQESNHEWTGARLI